MGSTPIIRSIVLGQKSYSFLSFLLFYATFKANKLCLKIAVAKVAAQNNGLKTQNYRGYTQNITTTFATIFQLHFNRRSHASASQMISSVGNPSVGNPLACLN